MGQIPSSIRHSLKFDSPLFGELFMHADRGEFTILPINYGDNPMVFGRRFQHLIAVIDVYRQLKTRRAFLGRT